MMRQNSRSVKSKITDFRTTNEQFSGRAGLSPVSRYLDAVGITGILAKRFTFLKKNAKGTALNSIFHQIICYFFDGTDLGRYGRSFGEPSTRSLLPKTMARVLLEYARPELIIYTNIGMNNEITRSILKAHKSDETEISPQAIINAYHFRARDELVNRALKDFGTKHLPFKRFASNAAFYYLMCVSFFLFESFKYDIDSPAIKITWYAESFRRKVLLKKIY